eukprot:35725-Amphidinium_carterae.2
MKESGSSRSSSVLKLYPIFPFSDGQAAKHSVDRLGVCRLWGKIPSCSIPFVWAKPFLGGVSRAF